MTTNMLTQLEIRRVLENYLYFVDMQDAKAVAACFAENGRFESTAPGTTPVQGRENLTKFFEGLVRLGKTIHGLSNLSIDVDGERAKSKSFCVSYIAGSAKPGDPILVRGLSYEDLWVRENQQWVISARLHMPI
ncbi:MAG: nuclear transport factor 2 family protein [Hyphomonadaceae bacterium]